MVRLSEKIGKIKAGSTTYDVRLAPYRDNPYRPAYDPVWPQSQDIPGAEGKVAGDPNIREWRMADWSGGEGFDPWEPENKGYELSTAVRPKADGTGLVIGFESITTQNDNGTPADLTECLRFGIAQGLLWTARDATAHWWQPATENWDETGWATGAGTDTATSIIDQGDGSNILIGYTNGTTSHSVRQVSSGANAALTGLTISATAGYQPVLLNYNGTLFHLNGDDLYSFTLSGSAATATLQSDLTGRSNDYLANGYQVVNRMTASDKGPVWYQRLDNGQTFIWEYNVANDTTKRLAKLPVDFAFPYDIYFAHGFVFVAFRRSNRHADAGDAHIYYFRAGQSGTAGPVRAPSGSASSPILIAGMIGDDLMFWYDDHLWAYNLTTGGIYSSGSLALTNGAETAAITFGADAFVCSTTAYSAYRFKGTTYEDTTAQVFQTGRFDFGYPGVEKVLLDVTVVHDPLPANTQVTAKYSVEGGSYAAISGADSTDNDTTYTWTVSSDTGNVVGKDFSIQLIPDTTDNTATVTIRSITARATSAAKQRSWILELDIGTTDLGTGGTAPRSSDVLADVRSIAEYSGLCLFTNPWDSEDWDAASTYQVLVEQVRLVEPENGEPFIQMRLRGAAYV